MLQESSGPDQDGQRRNAPSSKLAVLRVLRHSAMLRLWLAQIIYLSVQSAVAYGIVVRITEETNSATLVGLALIAQTLPTFLFGAPAGALVDRIDRRSVLWVSNALRALASALFVLALLIAPHQYFSLYLLALLFSFVGLFFTPAEGAIIPSLVERGELLPALALYNLTLNVSQAVGLLIIGPLALNLLPTIVLSTGQHQLILIPVATLFAGIAFLYVVAAVLVYSLPQRRPSAAIPIEAHIGAGTDYEHLLDAPLPGQVLANSAEPSSMNWRSLREDLHDGWRLVRGDPVLFDALLQACFGSLMMLSIAGLATIFVQRLLNLPTSDTALVFTPAGLGIVAGSLLVPQIVGRLGQTRTIIVGMLGMAVGIAMLPIAQHLARLADPSDWWIEPSFLLTVAGLTILVGFSLDCVIVPAQAEMQERSPDAMRGRVLALYQTFFNGGSLPVLLFMGALADLVGITVVLYVLAGISFCAALLSLFRMLSRNRRDSDRGSSRRVCPRMWRHHQTPRHEAAITEKLPELGAPL
jgi:MFS family permease